MKKQAIEGEKIITSHVCDKELSHMCKKNSRNEILKIIQLENEQEVIGAGG
jgi:hypothetical protein